jgi:hypothetical protein
MPDITMCFGEKIKLCKTCYRFLATPDRWQSFFSPKVSGKGKCEYYWECRSKGQKKRLDIMTEG